MNAALNVYGSACEVYPDGSRELTREERRLQIIEEISAEQLERGAHVCRIRAYQIDLNAGDEIAGTHIAHCRQYIAGCDERIENLRYELANLQPNPPRNDDGN